MAAFEYRAVDAKGRKTKGVISAESARAARKQLRFQQLTPVEVKPASKRKRAGASSGSSIRSQDLVIATRQLAMLIQSALPVEEALDAVASQSERHDVRRIFLSVRASVMEGMRLSDAMALEDRAFNNFYRAMVESGEHSGSLGLVLDRLADYLERTQSMQRKITNALIYPILLAITAVGVITALLVFVVPRIVEQFDSIGQDLPWITNVMLAISGAVRSYGFIAAIGLAALVFVFSRALRSKTFKRGVDGFLLRLPFVGKLNRNLNAARFARTFATLGAGGAPILDTLKAAQATVTNLVMRGAVDKIANAVAEGRTVSSAMKESGVFPPMVVHMTAAGESSGEVDQMMVRIADYLEEEFETNTSAALALLEPLIIIFMGAVVTLIILSIMLPVLQMNTLTMR